MSLNDNEIYIKTEIESSESDSCESDSDINSTGPEIKVEPSCETTESFPTKSKKRYERVYKKFKDWWVKKDKQKDTITENVLIEYFVDNMKWMKNSTVWTTYSMLKSTLQIHEKVNIGNFTHLKAFLKKHGDGYKAKKSQVFTRDQVIQFLSDAPDDDYLMHKVVMIIGLSGACRATELVEMKLHHITHEGQFILISIPDIKTSKPRNFVVSNSLGRVNPIEIFNKYRQLRPSPITHDRLFLNFKNGLCSRKPVGINTFYKIPSKVAEFLKLPKPEGYTGHCFRRTSASLFANPGEDLLRLRCLGGWNSSTVAEEPPAVSTTVSKVETPTNVVDGSSSTTTCTVNNSQFTINIPHNSSNPFPPRIINYGENCHITINMISNDKNV